MGIEMILGGLCLIAGGVFCFFKILAGKEKRERLPQKEDFQNTDKQLSKTEPSQNEDREKTEQQLRGRLLYLEKKRWELEANEPYEKLFDRIALPLQTLFGLAKVSFDSLEKERAEYYMWEAITEPLLAAVKHANGTLTDGRLVLPIQAVPFDEEEVKRRIGHFYSGELEEYLWEIERKLKMGEIAFQKKKIIEGLGTVVKKLADCRQGGSAEKSFVEELAREAQDVLERAGIYPMFAEDGRLEGHPRLRRDFAPLNRYSIKYPGLFIEREGKLEVLGAYIGMDDWESGH